MYEEYTGIYRDFQLKIERGQIQLAKGVSTFSSKIQKVDKEFESS